MTKLKLRDLTREQLEEKKTELESEIANLTKIIEVSNTTVFDLMINEIKEEMKKNVAEEEWKLLKANQRKVENFRNIENTLQNQEQLLEEKEDELEDVQSALDNYQPSLFEEQETNKPTNEDTGYRHKNQILETGDVYRSELENVTNGYWYYLIKKSQEKEDSFCIVSNFFPDEERLLQYPKNIDLLDGTEFIGNIYEDNDKETQQEIENAVNKIYTAES